MENTMVLYRELWNLFLRRKKHDRLPRTKKLRFIMAKAIVIYQNFLKTNLEL